jgi:hypothetical protein
MAKKETAKKTVKLPAKMPMKKTAKKNVKKKTGLLKKTLKEAGIWEDLIVDSGLDVEGSGLLAAEFATRPESTLADIWEDLESARSDLEAIILTHGDDVTPSELRKLFAK